MALTSTAVVLSLLADRGETDTPAGQLSLAMLIFQDLAIVAMILVVPMLAGTGGSGWAVAGGRSYPVSRRSTQALSTRTRRASVDGRVWGAGSGSTPEKVRCTAADSTQSPRFSQPYVYQMRASGLGLALWRRP